MKRFFAATLAGGLFTLLQLCPAGAAVYVSGRVLANQPAGPATGATVSLYTLDDSDNPIDVAQTLSNGSFVLRAPAGASYQIAVEGPAFERLEQAIKVPAKGLSSQVLRVDRRPFIQLHLIAPDGAPLKEGTAEVSLSLAGPGGGGGQYPRRGRGRRRGIGMWASQEVNENGGVDVILPYSLPQGILDGDPAEIIVSARRPGLGCGQTQLDHWPHDPVTIHLQPGVSLTGVVLDGEGKPLPDVPVTVMPLIGNGYGRMRQNGPAAVTGADGRFQMGQLISGSYVVMAQTPDGTRYFQSVQLEEPTSTVTLSPPDGR